jgi:tRNA nucleotidyltransferase (CCA-adding enzyme)
VTGIDELLGSVLREITPIEEERKKILQVFEKIRDALEKHLHRVGVRAEVTLQGSIAHETWLRGDRDLDVFVLYPEEWSVSDVKERGFQLIKEAVENIGRVEVRYAEHPYVRVVVDDVEADIVPAFKLKSPVNIRTAVDRTPFHTQFVVEHLKNGLNNDVRLLKKFMKTVGVYGAEVKTKGFSGYAAELLVIKYGGFLNTLKAASEWRPPVYVNTLGDEALFRDVVRRLVEKYPESIIYMPDPVDPSRNVTAAVSIEKLSTFILSAKCFLEKPSLRYFEDVGEGEPADIAETIDERCVILVEVEASTRLPPEVIWGELDRIRDRCVKFLVNHDFNVYYSTVWTDESKRGVVVLELDECEKPAYKLYEGPPFTDLNRVIDFTRKHAGKSVKIWLSREGKLMSISRRSARNSLDLLATRYNEYLVSPHFKNSKPVIYRVTRGNIEALASKYGFNVLKDLTRKIEPWLLECTS